MYKSALARCEQEAKATAPWRVRAFFVFRRCGANAPSRRKSGAYAPRNTAGQSACSVFYWGTMAIYHASMKIIGRQVKKGGKVVPGRHNSAVAAAAYQGGLKLRDERNEKTEDYSRKGGVAFTTVLT